MKRIPRSEALKRLFVERTRYRPITLDDDDTNKGSRVGGAPPKCFAGDPPKCARCGAPHEYLLTIEGDLVGPDIAGGKALSIFACGQTRCRLGSSSLSAEPPSVVAITHPPSPRDGDGDEEGRKLTRGHLRVEEREDDAEASAVETSKLGGGVFRIQTSIARDQDEAKRRGLVFLLQINEQELDEFTTNLGFWGGEVYLFTQRDPASGLPTLEGGRVCWAAT